MLWLYGCSTNMEVSKSKIKKENINKLIEKYIHFSNEDASESFGEEVGGKTPRRYSNHFVQKLCNHSNC